MRIAAIFFSLLAACGAGKEWRTEFATSDKKMTFQAARTYCKSLGGEMVHFQYGSQLQAVKGDFSKRKIKQAWIGSKVDSERRPSWVRNPELIAFLVEHRVDKTLRRGQCVVMKATYRFEGKSCYENQYAYCQSIVKMKYFRLFSNKAWNNAGKKATSVKDLSVCGEYNKISVINNAEQQREISEIMKHSGSHPAWLGCKTWTVRKSGRICYPNVASYEHWGEGESAVPLEGSPKTCVVIMPDGKWKRRNCKNNNKYTCQLSRPNKKFIIMQKGPAGDYAIFCDRFGLKVPYIENHKDQDEVADDASLLPDGESLWIGLYATRGRKSFHWIHNEKASITYTNWADGESSTPKPNKGWIATCVAVGKDGFWRQKSCVEEHTSWMYCRFPKYEVPKIYQNIKAIGLKTPLKNRKVKETKKTAKAAKVNNNPVGKDDKATTKTKHGISESIAMMFISPFSVKVNV